MFHGRPGTDGEWSLDSWKDLILLEPLNMFVKNDALAIIVDGDAEEFSLSILDIISFIMPLFLLTVPFLCDDLAGSSSKWMLLSFEEFL